MSTHGIINHRLFGQHSGFKECCIDFWLGPWQDWIENDAAKCNAYNQKIPPKTRYIPCPDCIEKNDLVKPHSCGPDCLPFLINDVKLPIKNAFWTVFDRVISGKFPTPAGTKIVNFEVERA